MADDDVEARDRDGEALPPYVPRTPLGRRLMEIRAQIVASGQPLLESWEDLEREIAERRGGTHLNDLS
ncbi:MAG: hypothetical protein ACRDJH_17635 [Thermomicrobiales bacterium]